MAQPIWISYDLGVRGDYEGLYTWLDERGAKECGDSLAYLIFEAKKDLVKELTASMKDALEITKKTRIYVIHSNARTQKPRGAWLFGGRKAPPWSGYAGGFKEDDEVDEGDEA